MEVIKATNVINDALGLIGFISFGEAPEAEAAALASRTLQGMLADFSIRESVNPKITTVGLSTPFADGNIYATVGSADNGNDIPVDILDIVDVKIQIGQVMYNLVQISYDEYQGLSIKTAPAVPKYFAFDYQEPQGKIYFHLAPMSGLNVVVMYRPRLTQIVNNQTMIALDLYWQQALVYNLATRLYPFFPGPAGLDPQIVYVAKSSLDHIKARNSKMNMKKARPGYITNRPGSNSFWTSPLNDMVG